MILAVANVKGGVGKSTLSVNIAIALARSEDVLLIDGDKQGTSAAFTELRIDALGRPDYTAVVLHGAAIRTQVKQLSPKYAHIVIDVGGRDNDSLRAALTVADTVLVPVKPRSFDLWGVDQTAVLIDEARQINPALRAIVVLNEADARGKDNSAALEALEEVEGIEVAPVSIVSRKAFPDAASAGLSVLEYNNAKAQDELEQLVKVLFAKKKGRK